MVSTNCTSLSALLTFSSFAFSAFALACSGSSTPVAPAPDQDKPADIVLVGGDIWTLDDGQPKATAIAIAGEHIVYVGDDDRARTLVGDKTTLIDLGGRSVTPGLVDSHAHLFGLGTALEAVALRGVESPDAAAKIIAEAAQDATEGEWITGRGWDHTRWSPAEYPHRKTLDAAVGNNPVAVKRVDGHVLWVSSAALAISGVTAKTADPEGGTIVRDAKGEPTGVFIDNAMELITSKIPEINREGIRRRILRASAAATAAGLTGVHEMGISLEVAEVYRELATDGELPIRVYAFLSGSDAAFATKPEQDKSGADWFTVRAFKLFADGALGSRGARLDAPYSDAADLTGLWLNKPEQLRDKIAEGTKRGWQIGVHAIGDGANREVLEAYAVALKGKDAATFRHRVEHAQVLRLADIARFAELGVIASMQPTHATSDMPWAEARVGPERIAGAYAWRSLLNAKARLAFGSDFPVEKVSPLLGLWSAVSRKSEDGEPRSGWRNHEAVTLDEALAGFTTAGAYASFSEGKRGQIKAGMLADLTVFESQLSAAGLRQLKIATTIVGGRVVFSSNPKP